MINVQTFVLFSLLISFIIVFVITIAMRKDSGWHKSFKFLFALMICQLISQTVIYLKVTGYLSYVPFLFRSSYPFELSSAPLVYLYLRSMTQPHFEIKSISKIHLVPALIGLTWYLVGQIFFPFPDDSKSPTLAYDIYLRTILSTIIIIPYLWKSREVILTFQEYAKNYYANLIDLRLPWLKYLLFVCYVAVGLKFLDVISGPFFPIWIYQGFVTNLGLIGLVYFALRVSELFNGEIRPVTPTISYESSEDAKLSEALLKRIRDEGLFLKPQIRLADLAEEMGIKSYRLSEIINHGLNTNFYDLINGMRIEHAKTLMQDPKNNHLNLLGVAMDSGFNSKSVFNDSFKRFVGMTPSEFRSNLKELS